jgi:hypothetical protein
MSLYRAGLRLALFLPLGIALAAWAALGFTDVSPVFTLPSRVKATLVDRTRVRKPSAVGSTCLSTSISLTAGYPTGREDQQRSQLGFNGSALGELHRDPMRIDARSLNA